MSIAVDEEIKVQREGQNEKVDGLQKKKDNRIGWLDILKGLGIISVVFGHIYKNDSVLHWIYGFHMPLFFFAGGWLYRKRGIVQDLKKRFFFCNSTIFCVWDADIDLLVVHRKAF